MRTEDAGTGNGVRQEVLDYYEQGFEDARLRAGAGRLELIRTQEVLRRFLPSTTGLDRGVALSGAGCAAA